MWVEALDKGVDLLREFSLEVAVNQRNTVRDSLMPALELTVGLRMVVCTMSVLHVFVFEIVGQLPLYGEEKSLSGDLRYFWPKEPLLNSEGYSFLGEY